MSDALNAMNCTTCGGSLPALAGHKAKALVCSYCGSVMDRHDGYKVLAQYRDMPRPSGPFRLGMTGEVMGIEQTVVGIVGVESRIEGDMYYWTNYQLYAPTHGYSWMTWNNGHLSHSRKVRDSGDHENTGFFPKSEFGAMGRTFKMFERYDAVIHYIEGELTWVPKIGDSVGVIDGIDPPYGFSMSHTGEELELEMQTYLDRDAVMESFGIDEDHGPAIGVHAIQPFNAGKTHTSMAAAAKYFVPVALLGALGVTLFGGGSTVANATLQASQLANPGTPAPAAATGTPAPAAATGTATTGTATAGATITGTPAGASMSFEAPSTSRLMSIEMRSNLSNQWAWYDMTLVHEESGQEIEFGNGMEYYSGYEGGESWSEGSQTATMRFKPPQAGKYTLRIAEAKDSTARKSLSIEVKQNVFVSRYFWILAIVLGLIYGTYWLRQWMFESARWGSGGDDDDD